MKCVNRYGTEHERVFSPIILTSMPAQQEWICKLCGEEGIKILTARTDPFEYDRVKKEFNDRKGATNDST